MSSRHHQRSIATALGALMLAALIPTAAAAVTRPLTFHLELGSECLAGRSSDNAAIDLTWRDAAGELKASTTVTADGAGRWSACFGDDPANRLKIGDRLRATIGSVTRRLVVPDLTLKVERVADRYSGRGPAGSKLHLGYSHGLYTDHDLTAKITVQADGTWSFDPGHDVIGGFYAYIWKWRSAQHDVIDGVFDRVTVPYLVVTLGSSRFSGVTRPGRTVEVALADGVTSEPKATGIAVGGPGGGFVGRFRDEQDDPVKLAAGDHLRAPDLASDADWIVPKVNGTANAGTDVVRGRCFDAGTSAEFFEIRVLAPNGNQRGSAIGQAGSEPFEVDFGSQPELGFDPANIRSGDTVSIGCLQETGDWVQKAIVVA